MRIISGEWKSRRIEAAPDTRPTGDRVREALFSILGGAHGGTIDGLFVDLYAGGGAVGLEARSRGARVVFVEREAASIQVLRANLDELDVRGGVRVVEGDVLRFLKSDDLGAETARVVFADPPYDRAPVAKLLRLIGAAPFIDETTSVVVEHRRGRPLPDAPPPLELQRTLDYGETSLSFLTKASSSRA